MIKQEHINEVAELIKNPAWMAGFFDGEGCISVYKIGTTNLGDKLALRVSLTQKDIILLVLVSIYWKGYVTNYRNEVARVIWNGPDSKHMLESILPFSTVKRIQIEQGLKFIETIDRTKMRNSEDYAYRQELFELLKSEKE